MTGYGIHTRLDVPYAEAIARVTAALAAEGFGVLTEIDVKATLKKKLDIDFRDYVILGACNPHLAHRAMSAEIEVGLLLPCNVVVYADDTGGSVVEIADPITVLAPSEAPELMAVAEEARARLTRVAGALG